MILLKRLFKIQLRLKYSHARIINGIIKMEKLINNKMMLNEYLNRASERYLPKKIMVS